MKHIFSAIMAVIFVFALFLPLNADSLSAENEKDTIINYYSQNLDAVTTAEQIIIFGSANAIQGSSHPDIWNADLSDETNYASAILVSLSLEKSPHTECNNGKDPVKELAALQHENGSFGDLEQTVYAASAMQAAQVFTGDEEVIYSQKAAVTYILSLAKEDGGYGSVYLTAKALSYLAYFKSDTQVNNAVTNGVKYIRSMQLEGGGFEENSATVLCTVICALIDCGEDVMTSVWNFMPDRVLAKYRNSDGTYRMYQDGEDKFDDAATMAALSVFDAKLSAQSAVMKLMTHGIYSRSIWENAKGFIIGFAILAFLSLIFWGYILFGKKKTIDKQNGDNYGEDDKTLQQDS